jgi:fumarate hydratase subunit beta
MAESPVLVTTPLDDEVVRSLRAGMRVLISGTIYTVRDAAHKRLVTALENGETPPFPLTGNVIYYVGPSPAQPGQIIGSAGPTTSSRVDPYTPLLLQHGLKGMIGKGKRNAAVREAMQTHNAVYFVAVGGAAALISERIKAVKIIAYDDLGTEAIREMVVEDFPAAVGNDAHGGDLYEDGKKAYQHETN